MGQLAQLADAPDTENGAETCSRVLSDGRPGRQRRTDIGEDADAGGLGWCRARSGQRLEGVDRAECGPGADFVIVLR